MAVKRKNRGRHKGRKGRQEYVQCSNCGARIPRDKAIKVVRRFSLVDPSLAKELRQQGALILSKPIEKYYCVSCAVHYGIVRIGGYAERMAREET